MARYLDAKFPEGSRNDPDIATKIRTNPRVKAILWSTGAAMACLFLIALIASHVF
jgi:hypothetical protein